MSLLWILGSWTFFLLGALYYLGLLGTGNTVVKESTSGKDSTKPADDETISKMKKKYAKKKRKKKKRRDQQESAVVTKEQMKRNQEEKPDSLPETNGTKEKSQATKSPVNQTKKLAAKKKKSIPLKTHEAKAIPYMTHEKNATSILSLPQTQYSPSTDITPGDVTPAASHSTSNDFTQSLSSFRAPEAASPLLNYNEASANTVQAPARLLNAQAPAPLVSSERVSAPLVSETAATAPKDANDIYPAANSLKVNELEDEEAQETDNDAPIEELGDDWFAYKSTEYGVPYYHNARTLETVWERPIIEPVVESFSDESVPDEPDLSEVEQKLYSRGDGQQVDPTLQNHVPTVQQQSPLNQQQSRYMGQGTMYSSQRGSLSRPTTFAEKLRLAKQRPPVAVPKLLVKTKQKKAPVAGLPPPLYAPMPQTTDTSSWATVSATPAPKKLITTSSQWVKVGVPPEPVAPKKDRPTREKQLIDFRTALMQGRVAKKWKQHEFAKKLDIRPQELSKYEQGKDIPSPALINKMTRVLGVKLPRVKKSKMKELQPLPDD